MAICVKDILDAIAKKKLDEQAPVTVINTYGIGKISEPYSVGVVINDDIKNELRIVIKEDELPKTKL